MNKNRLLRGAQALGVLLGLLLTLSAQAQVMCTAHPKNQWMKESELRRLLEDNGYVISTLRVAGNCYEMEGITAEGAYAHLWLDTVTADVMDSQTDEEGDG